MKTQNTLSLQCQKIDSERIIPPNQTHCKGAVIETALNVIRADTWTSGTGLRVQVNPHNYHQMTFTYILRTAVGRMIFS